MSARIGNGKDIAPGDVQKLWLQAAAYHSLFVLTHARQSQKVERRSGVHQPAVGLPYPLQTPMFSATT